jgi:spore coat protein A, manganese oxidase
VTRRTFFEASLLSAAVGSVSAQHADHPPIDPNAIPGATHMATSSGHVEGVSVGHRLARFVDPLPIPPVIKATTEDCPVVPLELRAARQKVHRDLPPTTIWGYNGSWPGPTIEVRRGRPITVQWKNSLPANHLLPVDPTICGAEEDLPAVRTVAHLHGAAVHPDHDGYPEAWFTSSGQTGPSFKSTLSAFPNDQSAATLWYHDHCIGLTRLNMYAGLAGFYLIRDEEESGLNLPSGKYEIPLLLQDRQFRANGSLLYPKVKNGTHPIWIQEFFGDVVCVNGKATPYLDVEPRKYRLRFLNGSNARFYHLQLVERDVTGKLKPRAEVPIFRQIGTDGGLLPAPVPLHYLLIGPGERFDVVVDFAEFAGKHFLLSNDAPAPYTMGGEVVPSDVMLIRVNKPLAAPDTSEVPDQLTSFEILNPSHAVQERVLSVSELERPSDGYVQIGLLGKARWHDPVTENPQAGTSEIWSFANTTGDVHPLHLHLVQFQVLNRQTFDVPTYLASGKLILTGRPIAPELNERPAMKDTVKAYPGYVTRIVQRFRLPSGVNAKPGESFRYVWHCHILEHEDNEMMRPYVVTA